MCVFVDDRSAERPVAQAKWLDASDAGALASCEAIRVNRELLLQK